MTQIKDVPQDGEQLRAVVRERYTQSVKHLLDDQQPQSSSCCGPQCCTPQVQPQQQVSASGCCDSTCCSSTDDAVAGNLYSAEELGTLPLAAALASRGCGNPVALAELKTGERVLDLGSGGGIDVLLSARRVGPDGFAYGLDMTDAMLELAERNRRESGIENVRFLKGEMEAIPLPEQAVDVIISNCVINLSADKRLVLGEAYRVLAPEGRFAISDIVVLGQLPPVLRQDMESWAGCIAGALEEQLYRQLLTEAGFVDIDIEVTRRYSVEDIAESGASASLAMLSEEEVQDIAGKFVSAFVRARKPTA